MSLSYTEDNYHVCKVPSLTTLADELLDKLTDQQSEYSHADRPQGADLIEQRTM